MANAVKIAWRIEHRTCLHGPYTASTCTKISHDKGLPANVCMTFGSYAVHFGSGLICGFKSRRRFNMLRVNGLEYSSEDEQIDAIRRLHADGYVLRAFLYEDGLDGTYNQVAFNRDSAVVVGEVSLLSVLDKSNSRFWSI